ncbi:MAG: CsgG/HfaB family protein [Lentisphaeria bacterium]|jgi:uncharacterized protein YlaN (UPF0358 family)
MRRLLTLLAALLLGAGAQAQLTQGGKDPVAIARVKVLPSVAEAAKARQGELALKRITETLEAQFTPVLSSTRVFDLVERTQKADLELEQAYAAVAVDPNDKNAASALKMAGVRFLVMPQVTAFEDRTDVSVYQVSGLANVQRRIYLAARLQIVDATTGKLLPEAPAAEVRQLVQIDQDVNADRAKSDEFLVGAADEMARQLCWKLVASLRPAKVLALTGDQVMINRGTDAGFAKGLKVGIFATEAVTDEDTGEMLTNEVPVGKATVVRAEAGKSFAKVEGENLGIAKGCVVRADLESLPPPAPAAPAAPAAPLPAGSSEKPLQWK